jgi:PKD repeat protein
VVVVVVIIVALVGVAVLAYAHDSGTVNITVSSTHLTDTVTVTVSVDGTQVASQSLAPGNSMQVSHMVYVGSGCQTVTVLATSTGGGLGPQTDSATPTVCAGASVPVTLYV